MPVANIRISKGPKVLHGWYIHPIPYEMTVKDFFLKLITKEISSESGIAIEVSEVIERVELSEAPVSTATQVIIELTSSIGVHIHYRLKNDTSITPDIIPQRNSFMIMMQNAHRTQLYLPTFSQSGKANRKQTLHSDLVDWIRLIFIMEDGLLNHLLIHKENNLLLVWLKQFGILTCVIMKNSKSVVVIYLRFSMSFLAVQIPNHTSSHENPLMQMNSICIVKPLPHILHHHGC